MGTTICTVHAFTDRNVPESFGRFVQASEQWRSLFPDYEDCDFDKMRSLARKLSKTIVEPTLWFWEFDDDEYGFRLFQGGKCVAQFDSTQPEGSKGLFKIPSLVGYPEGNKRRISRILSCGDTDLAIAMLEEFFGVPLNCSWDELELPLAADDRRGKRGTALYDAFAREEKLLRGAAAPVRVCLRREFPGKLFGSDFDDRCGKRPHLFFFGYDDPNDEYKPPVPVEFTQGRLKQITREEFYACPAWPILEYKDPRFQIEFDTRDRVVFTKEAPAAFQGKTFILPVGYYPEDLLGTDKLVLSGGRSSLAIMDEDGNIIAKMSVKGEPCEVRDGFVMTTTADSFVGYYYHPNAVVRIYELIDGGAHG